jgi:hypothetical protein
MINSVVVLENELSARASDMVTKPAGAAQMRSRGKERRMPKLTGARR